MERFYPENAKELSKLMNTCSNKSFKIWNIEHEIESNIKIIFQDF